MRTERSRERIGEYRIDAVHAGAGPPVVLLHGLSGSHRWWRYTIPALARGYRVHAPELSVFGESWWIVRQPDIGELASLVAHWLDAHAIERAHLVGHSMGGQIAIHLAARSPARIDRLVLVDAAGIPFRFRPLGLPRFFLDLAPPRAWGRLGFLPTMARDALRAGPRRLARAIRHLLADDVRPLLARVRSRTLVVWGEWDPVIPRDHGRRLAERIPDARLIVLEGASHNPMVDKPGAFNRTLLAFLAEP